MSLAPRTLGQPLLWYKSYKIGIRLNLSITLSQIQLWGRSTTLISKQIAFDNMYKIS